MAQQEADHFLLYFWRYEAAMVRAIRSSLGHCIQVMQNSKLYAGWSAWRACVHDTKRQIKMTKGVLQRMLHRNLSAPVQKWQHEALEMKASTQSVRRAVMHLTSAQLAAGFGLWRELRNQPRE